MTDLTEAHNTPLPTLIDRAAGALSAAKDSAEVLEARDMARVAYDAAKSASRMARAKKAHESVMSAVYRAQADALLIEARAKMRLADEYDAAQERGEVAKLGDNLPSVDKHNAKPTAADVGLRRDEIHEARKLRDAEKADPGKTERALAEMVASGEDPTKAKLRRAVFEESTETPQDASGPDQPRDPKEKERKSLSKLTREALEDEVIGLREALADEKAKHRETASKLKEARQTLADHTADDKDDVIRRLQAKNKHLSNQMFKANEDARIAIAARRRAEDRAKELEGMGIAL